MCSVESNAYLTDSLHAVKLVQVPPGAPRPPLPPQAPGQGLPPRPPAAPSPLRPTAAPADGMTAAADQQQPAAKRAKRPPVAPGSLPAPAAQVPPPAAASPAAGGGGAPPLGEVVQTPSMIWGRIERTSIGELPAEPPPGRALEQSISNVWAQINAVRRSFLPTGWEAFNACTALCQTLASLSPRLKWPCAVSAGTTWTGW